jgi:putative tryptophan/tyrosine transport system substrate-binding protein
VNRRFPLACAGMVAAAFALGLAAASAAESARKVVRVGFVSALSASTYDFTPFWVRLRELGWVEGQNLLVERRYADGHLDRLPALMAEVIDRKIDVLCTYGPPGSTAAKNATSTVPIVAWALADPSETGLVTSLARPGGNLTGLTAGWDEGIGGKWLELLREAIPTLSTVAVIVNPANRLSWTATKELEARAPMFGLKSRTIELHGPEALDPAFEQARRRAQAVVILGEPITLEQKARVTALAAKYRLPAVYFLREYVEAGGLMSYGADYAGMIRRGAEYVDKVLRGTKPADLPIERPTKYVLVINLKTAQALGLTIPQSILLRADEVIR